MGCENNIAETDGFSVHEYKFLHGLLNLFFFLFYLEKCSVVKEKYCDIK